MAIKFPCKNDVLPGQLPLPLSLSLTCAVPFQKQNGDLRPHQVDDSADSAKGNLGLAVIPNFDPRPLTGVGAPFKNLRGGK